MIRKRLLYIHLVITFFIGFVVRAYNLIEFEYGLVELFAYFGLYHLIWLAFYPFNKRYPGKIIPAWSLLLFFLKELTVSNFKVIKVILCRKLNIEPAVLAFPLTIKSETGITILANLITLTPGTLSLKVAEDKSMLFFHTIDVKDRDIAREIELIKNGFEKRIIKLME